MAGYFRDVIDLEVCDHRIAADNNFKFFCGKFAHFDALVLCVTHTDYVSNMVNEYHRSWVVNN